MLLAEQFGGDWGITARREPSGVEVATAHMGGDDQVIRLVGDYGVDDVEILLLQTQGILVTPAKTFTHAPIA